ncbi:MAG: hypothetical protein OEL83_16390 [Desulforhopalus sp.]|nr:hypothetical protein [Desulforhopalus sp.]
MQYVSNTPSKYSIIVNCKKRHIGAQRAGKIHQTLVTELIIKDGVQPAQNRAGIATPPTKTGCNRYLFFQMDSDPAIFPFLACCKIGFRGTHCQIGLISWDVKTGARKHNLTSLTRKYLHGDGIK